MAELVMPGEPSPDEANEKPANGFACFPGVEAGEAGLKLGMEGEAISLVEDAPTPRILRCSCSFFSLDTGVFICLCDLSTGAALVGVGSVSALS